MESSENQGFLELVAANRDRILRVSRAYSRTPQDAEDLYQEILFQIWRGLPSVREKSVAGTWMYRVAINTAIGFVRKSRSRNGRLRIEPVGVAEQPDPRNQSRRDDRLEALHEAMARLNPVEKGVITLFLEDCTYQQIAEVMGMNANHVGVLLHRTKKKLSELMQESQ